MKSSPTNPRLLKKFEGTAQPHMLQNQLRERNYQKRIKNKITYIDFKCPVCGFIHTFGKHHKIDLYGRVTPSVTSGSVHCGFHEWVLLTNWKK